MAWHGMAWLWSSKTQLLAFSRRHEIIRDQGLDELGPLAILIHCLARILLPMKQIPSSAIWDVSSPSLICYEEQCLRVVRPIRGRCLMLIDVVCRFRVYVVYYPGSTLYDLGHWSVLMCGSS